MWVIEDLVISCKSFGEVFLEVVTNKGRDKNLYFTFIDFSKAYDSVSREMLISTLRKYNIHQKGYSVNVTKK